MVSDPNDPTELERVHLFYQWDPYVVVVQRGHKGLGGEPARSLRGWFYSAYHLASVWFGGVCKDTSTLPHVAQSLMEVFGFGSYEMRAGDPLNPGGN